MRQSGSPDGAIAIHPKALAERAAKIALTIDLYIWLAYRLHVLRAPVEVGWPALRRQFGESYAQLRFFRRDALPPLRLALAVYPEARVIIDEKAGLILYPSPPPVSERKAVI